MRGLEYGWCTEAVSSCGSISTVCGTRRDGEGEERRVPYRGRGERVCLPVWCVGVWVWRCGGVACCLMLPAAACRLPSSPSKVAAGSNLCSFGGRRRERGGGSKFGLPTGNRPPCEVYLLLGTYLIEALTLPVAHAGRRRQRRCGTAEGRYAQDSAAEPLAHKCSSCGACGILPGWTLASPSTGPPARWPMCCRCPPRKAWWSWSEGNPSIASRLPCSNAHIGS